MYRLGSQRPAAAPATNQASAGVPVDQPSELLVNPQMIQTIRNVAAELNIKEPSVMKVATGYRMKRNARTTSQMEDLTVDDFRYLMDAFEQQRVALQRKAQQEVQTA